MNAMILAAGRGERLRPVTDTRPKALVEVRGEILIDRHLRMLAAAGVDTVVINLGWLGEQIVAHVGSGEQFGVNVVYSPEYDNVLETGGGIYRALPMLGADPFWVTNGDVFTDIHLSEHVLSDDADAHLILVPTPTSKSRSDFGLHDGRVTDDSKPDLTYSGIARYRPSFFAAAGDGAYSVAPMLFATARKDRLSGSLHDGIWEDVGTPERLKQLNEAQELQV